MIEKGIELFECSASFLDAHTIKLVDKDGKEQVKTAEFIIIACGGRPWIPDVPGKEHMISSDDLFWLKKSPGKTLVLGAGYVALQCAGFLTATGHDVTVAVRSVLLRAFD